MLFSYPAVVILICALIIAAVTIYYKRRKRRLLLALEWPDNLSRKELSKYCAAYLRHNGWDIRYTSDHVLQFRMISKNNVQIGACVRDQQDRNAGPETFFIRRIGETTRYAKLADKMKFICIVNFDISDFAREVSAREGYATIHFRELSKLTKLVDLSVIDIDQIESGYEYLFSHNMAICRQFANDMLKRNDLDRALKWGSLLVSGFMGQPKDYMFVAEMHKKRGEIDIAAELERRAGLIAQSKKTRSS